MRWCQIQLPWLLLARALGVWKKLPPGSKQPGVGGLEVPPRRRLLLKKVEFQVWSPVTLKEYLEIEEIINSQVWNGISPWEAPFLFMNSRMQEFVAEKLRIHWHLGCDPIPNFWLILWRTRYQSSFSPTLATYLFQVTCWVKRGSLSSCNWN